MPISMQLLKWYWKKELNLNIIQCGLNVFIDLANKEHIQNAQNWTEHSDAILQKIHLLSSI